MPGPLEGVRVADFTQIIAGPLGGRILAEMGADVIKIEPLGGEPWRLTQRFTPPDSPVPESRTFMCYNRGKRSLPLDLTTPEAQDILSRLVRHIDVVLVNFRPDVAVKLGVDYESLSAVNPRLVYCELTAYGRRGPDAHRPGYDMIIQAMTGMIASETKTVDDVPSWVWSSPLIDTASGIAMAGSVSAALYARERTGVGQKIETTLLGQALNLMGARFVHVEKLDKNMRERTLRDIEEQRQAGASYDDLVALSPGSRRREHHGNIYYRVYMAADGPIGVGCLSQPLRLRLLETLDLTDESMAPGWDPTTPESREYTRHLEHTAEEIFRSKPSSEWLRILEERNIPAGPVRFIEEMFDDPQVVANDLVDEFEHLHEGAVRMVGHYAQYSGTPPSHTPPSPALGQHTAEILSWLGYSPEEVGQLRDSKAVG